MARASLCICERRFFFPFASFLVRLHYRHQLPNGPLVINKNYCNHNIWSRGCNKTIDDREEKIERALIDWPLTRWENWGSIRAEPMITGNWWSLRHIKTDHRLLNPQQSGDRKSEVTTQQSRWLIKQQEALWVARRFHTYNHWYFTIP